MTTFKQLGLSDQVLKVLPELGYEHPTDIQKLAIPQLLTGSPDFIGQAQTGTGKTAAFGLPLLERIDPFLDVTQALVLAPTRELGQQIASELNLFSKYLPKVNVLPVYGGAAISNQIKALRKPQHVIIATPGRLLDLIRRKAIKLSQVRLLVLDEADEMLNMGFKEDLDDILSYTPDDKMTWLISATMPEQIKRIVKKYMNDPFEVKVNPKKVINANIDHQFAIIRPADKTEGLTRFLDLNPDMRGLVFCRTKRDTERLTEQLIKKNYKVDALHGNLSQHQRDRVMKRFKTHELKVVIATDVAARGIDVNDLTHVFHHSLPDDQSYYTHRSGRTARAGKDGISIAFINSREHGKLNRLANKLGISFTKISIPSSKEIADVRVENWCRKILGQKINGKLGPQLINKARSIFEDLSKEELIAKMLTSELEHLNLNAIKDLNDTAPTQRTKSSGQYRSKKKGDSKKRWKKSKGKSARKRRWTMEYR